MNYLNKVRDNVDWTQVTSILVAGVIVGGFSYVAVKAGLPKAAVSIATGGK